MGSNKARCPYCFSHIRLRHGFELWHVLACEECGTPLQVVKLDPPELDYVDADELESEDYWVEDDWDGHLFSEN